MPIVVAHGGVDESTAAGQIIAQAGQANLNRQQQASMQADQLASQRAMQIDQINAQADRQRQAADDAYARTALQHGLDDQIREEEFDKTLKLKQADAKSQAEQWDYKYTSQQRQQIAGFNQSRQMIQNSPRWSDGEKRIALRQIDLAQAGITPSMMPADPMKRNDPPGQGVGQVWEENGVLMSRNVGGDLWQPDERKSPRYLKSAQENVLKLEKLKQLEKAADREYERETKRSEAINKYREKLAEEDAVQDGLDENGKSKWRTRTADEIESAVQRTYGGRQSTSQQSSGRRAGAMSASGDFQWDGQQWISVR